MVSPELTDVGPVETNDWEPWTIGSVKSRGTNDDVDYLLGRARGRLEALWGDSVYRFKIGFGLWRCKCFEVASAGSWSTTAHVECGGNDLVNELGIVRQPPGHLLV